MNFRFKPQISPEISRKSWRDFRFDGNVFTTQMDPDSQATSFPVPSKIWGNKTRVYDVEYLGGSNDADNTVAIATLDTSGAEWELFDAGALPIELAYLGLGMSSGSRNDAYNQQFVNVMLESLSAAYATQLTEIAFLTSTYTTDIPEMEKDQSAIVGFMVWYQSVLQNVAGVIAKYNTLMSMQDALVSMGYNYEAPETTGMFNLLKKQNVYANFDQLGVILSQEYFDVDWFHETTVLNALPTKEADDIQSPLLSIVAPTIIPHVTMTESDQLILDTTNEPSSSDDYATYGWSTFNYIPVTITQNNTTTTKRFTFQGLCYDIMSGLDPVRVLRECRQIHNKTIDTSVTDYVNALIAELKALVAACASFKKFTVDIRTFLSVLQRSTNLNHWVVNTPYLQASRPRQQLRPECVRVVSDIFKATGTNGNLVLDDTTRKWKIYTLWKGGDGIAAYDAFNGGFAISASVRGIPSNDDGYESVNYMFPRMFYRYGTTAYMIASASDSSVDADDYVKYTSFVNRVGAVITVTPTAYTSTTLAANPFFAYLNAIDHSDLTCEVPTVDLSATTTSYVRMATINKLLLTVYGIGQGTYLDTSKATVTNYGVNTENIMFVGRQFGSFSEDSVDYLNARAPMRQTDKDVRMGFKYSTHLA